mmetsp:Transcript_103492/g.183845  ORF Transcript_103492/g.183845 Transcript_103492/m.183845 type:complete len:346 (+) Transcript_103492:69-1106(+)|eukprot:CAMPEP_0197652990 /NCGR_PEP_ID=MMETSP1338-20131121/34780_1 /TAXON_ID=43686 ORGANISM="Pelagodinium beii, Strain RCC1491" /NCGR_SAMPLE_ID=MMETSP1338 /ASSEMBLY_ACC=CAM_ASM_000754 /LENGTH=345 /DNA_ID=CAMNT_0043227973 /DNA_START=69 /DNA_END=1106 /DNA_ORIENTATION=-
MGLEDFAGPESPTSRIKVKNTFLEFDDELSLQEDGWRRRQQSEPSPSVHRRPWEDEEIIEIPKSLRHQRWADEDEGDLSDRSTRVSSEERQIEDPAAQPVAEVEGWEEVYTVMMRNLPNKYSRKLLVQEILEAGFGEAYNFLYLPMDHQTGANRGYAFINFVSPSLAQRFKLTYEGKSMKSFNSTKVVTVAPAALQGFEANLEHYSSARVSRGAPGCRPIFLRGNDMKELDSKAAECLQVKEKLQKNQKAGTQEHGEQLPRDGRRKQRRRNQDAKDCNYEATHQQPFGYGGSMPVHFQDDTQKSVLSYAAPYALNTATSSMVSSLGMQAYCAPGMAYVMQHPRSY